MQKQALCCPTPAFNALHPHEVPNSSTGIPTTPGYACTNPLFVTSCGTSEPPEDVTLEGQDCEGNTVETSAPPGQIVYAVQAPGTTFKVQLCENPRDTEKVVLCDKNTDHKVAVISDLTDPTAPVVTFWDLNTGAPWTGNIDDLEACPGTTLESDPVEMCDAGTEFLRWIVKENGKPTGTKFDTDLTGALYTVTDEAGVTVGKCVAELAPPEISDAFGNDLSALRPSDQFIFDATTACAKPPCVYQIVTDAGTFRVRAGSAITTKTFSSKVTVQSVSVLSGGCSLADLHIIGNSN